MPHDLNGLKVERGDFVKAQLYTGKTIGVVGAISEGSETCNLTVHYLAPGQVMCSTVTAKECEIMMRADGSEPA